MRRVLTCCHFSCRTRCTRGWGRSSWTDSASRPAALWKTWRRSPGCFSRSSPGRRRCRHAAPTQMGRLDDLLCPPRAGAVHQHRRRAHLRADALGVAPLHTDHRRRADAVTVCGSGHPWNGDAGGLRPSRSSRSIPAAAAGAHHRDRAVAGRNPASPAPALLGGSALCLQAHRLRPARRARAKSPVRPARWPVIARQHDSGVAVLPDRPREADHGATRPDWRGPTSRPTSAAG